jgi:hypothetical protein|tara:strand:- start:2810 stop:3592 length:783 start_codon:yes stop_codon:yes gene_type:complete
MLKNVLGCFVIATIAAFLTHLVVYGQYVSNQLPVRDLSTISKISDARNVNSVKSIKKSRTSSVRVMSLDIDGGMISTSSGTFFVYDNTNYVITTSHGLLGGCETIQIESDGELFDCFDEIVIDKQNDYAILEVDYVTNRKPLTYPKDFVKNNNGWSKSLTLLNKIVYTGYPNSIGPLTVAGNIMGFDSQGLIYIQSYAWSGSSGSGVFDQSGKLMGYILAIDVGQNEFGTAILENVMIVVPIYKVDWSVITKKELTNVGK